MKKQEMKLSISLFAYFAAALTMAVGKDNVYYRCRDSSISDNSRFIFSCNTGRVIIVKSAIIGATDKFTPPQQCPITNNTCLKEITIVAELCTGRNSCDITQNILLYNESKLSCPQNGLTVGNFIIVNYTCIDPEKDDYGDICYFDGDLFSNSAVYISSSKFPDAMGPEVNYQCSCQLTSKSSSSSASVTIRALLVKLPSSYTTCSERLSIIDSGNETKLSFCSPCNNANNVTTVPLVSSPVVILFQRDESVSPYNGKFILEITVSSGSGSMGSFKCGFVGSTISSSTNVTTTSPSYSSTTTSAILSQPNGFSNTNVQNTSLGSTMRSSNMSTSTHQSILSSTKPASEISNAALSSSIAPRTPTLIGQSASEKESISIGGIIGIVLGSVGLIVIVVIVLLCLLRKQKQNHGRRKENTNFKIEQSVTVIQNMQTTNNIEPNSTELHTLQSAAHYSNEPQTAGYDNYCQTIDNSMSNYEEGAPVSDIAYGPGMIHANEQTRLSDKMADDLTTETQSMNSGDGDLTLIENQLYGENEKPMTDAVASTDYDVVRSVVQNGRTDKSAGVDCGYAVVQMKNSSADHSYYNVQLEAGSGTVQPAAEVSAEAETNSTSDEIEATNPMYKADSDVILIDNALYGSLLTF